MPALRLSIFLTTIIIVGIVGTIATFFARGYRFDNEKGNFSANGLLVVNSDPNGAQILINGELKTATNATVSLFPGIYDVTVKKEGFLPWYKRLTIEKEIVTQVNVTLFSSAPSLSAVTLSGSVSPILSPDMTKIAYAVPFSLENQDKAGLWVLETVNLPLGFNREPKRITDGDISKGVWEWSPNSNEILLNTQTGLYLLNANEFTPQNQRVNVSNEKLSIYAKWENEKQKKQTALISNLPIELADLLKERTRDVSFSPNEDLILYTATASGVLKQGITKSLPGSSTQKEERDIKPGKKYVYDIKEDRNFAVLEGEDPIFWLPTSLNLVIAEKNQISIIDYDGNNKQAVFTGSYVYPFVFPTTSTNKVLILTNFGAFERPSNIYALGIK